MLMPICQRQQRSPSNIMENIETASKNDDFNGQAVQHFRKEYDVLSNFNPLYFFGLCFRLCTLSNNRG